MRIRTDLRKVGEFSRLVRKEGRCQKIVYYPTPRWTTDWARTLFCKHWTYDLNVNLTSLKQNKNCFLDSELAIRGTVFNINPVQIRPKL